MKISAKTALLTLLCSILFISSAFAHGGRTDANEGHRDNYNASGLGSYHYHCGSAPAHLHNNGVCPYAYTETYVPDPEPIYAPPTQAEKPTISDLNSAGRKDDRYIAETPSSSPLDAVSSADFFFCLVCGGFGVAVIFPFLSLFASELGMNRLAVILEKIATIGVVVGLLGFLFPIWGGMAFVAAIFAIPKVFKKLFFKKP